MAKVNYIHSEEARQDWLTRPITYQMGNIGSEVSRAVNSKKRGNEERMMNAAARAIELFELSIDCNIDNPARLKELCRGKEEFCDYIYGGNTFLTNPEQMVRYYDQFVTLIK